MLRHVLASSIATVSCLLVALIAPAPAPAAVGYPLAATVSTPDLAVIIQIAIVGSSSLRTWCVGNDGIRHSTVFQGAITGLWVYPRNGPGQCSMSIAGPLMRQFANLPTHELRTPHIEVRGSRAAWTVDLRR